jgi:hypothetical protein
VETIVEFVARTKGPVVPYVDSWYPWVYAHHYLRGEAAEVPGRLANGRPALSPSDARELIHLWCALTGEGIGESARLLADAYLARWGIVRNTRPTERARTLRRRLARRTPRRQAVARQVTPPTSRFRPAHAAPEQRSAADAVTVYRSGAHALLTRAGQVPPAGQVPAGQRAVGNAAVPSGAPGGPANRGPAHGGPHQRSRTESAA